MPVIQLARRLRNGTEADFDSIQQISESLAEFRHERDWTPYHTPQNLAISITIEAAELLEHFQWASDDEVASNVAENPEAVAAELADVAIYVLQLAQVLGISLSDAIRAKIAENAVRYPVSLARGNHRKHDQLG